MLKEIVHAVPIRRSILLGVQKNKHKSMKRVIVRVGEKIQRKVGNKREGGVM
jgi:hypothetical protein